MPDRVVGDMRSFRLVAGLAGTASALTLLFVGLESGEGVDAFLVVFVALQAAPFGLLITLAERSSVVGRWLGLGVGVALYALAYYEFFRPDQVDGQAGLIFLFLPFYVAALVLAVWVVDQIVRAVARRVSR